MTAQDERWFVFPKRRDGMIHALDGGMWYHRHVFRGKPMAHVVSSNRRLLLRAGRRIGMKPEWLQYKPLKDPRTGGPLDAWHWDLGGWALEAGERLAETGVAGDGEVKR